MLRFKIAVLAGLLFAFIGGICFGLVYPGLRKLTCGEDKRIVIPAPPKEKTSKRKVTPVLSSCDNLALESKYILGIEYLGNENLVSSIAGDIDNDGQNESLVFYAPYKQVSCTDIESDNQPLMARVLSGDISCPREEFRYIFNRGATSGTPDWYYNLVRGVKYYRNFYNHGQNAFVINMIATGCGSGDTGNLFVLTSSRKRGYHMISGPEVGSSTIYKLVGKPYPGVKLITATFIWGPGEAHYGNHRYHLKLWRLNEENNSYVLATDLGETERKYSYDRNESMIDQILRAEPKFNRLLGNLP